MAPQMSVDIVSPVRCSLGWGFEQPRLLELALDYLDDSLDLTGGVSLGILDMSVGTEVDLPALMPTQPRQNYRGQGRPRSRVLHREFEHLIVGTTRGHRAKS